MDKLLFFDLEKQLIRFDNLSLRSAEIKKENTVFDSVELPYEGSGNGYFSLVQKDEQVLMYYRAAKSVEYQDLTNSKRCLAVSNDGGRTFTRKISNSDNIVLQGTNSATNLSVFQDKDNQLKAIGGNHFHLGLCDLYNENIRKENLKVERVTTYYIHPLNGKRKAKWMDIQSGLFSSKYDMNGLYLYSSPDSLNWSKFRDTPIIHGLSKGQVDRVNGYTTFDCPISIFFHPHYQKYYLYVRSNIGRCVRYIQYTTSTDLVNWDKLRLINLDPSIKSFKDLQYNENYYYPNIHPYPNSKFFIGIPLYFVYPTHEAGNYLIMSDDGTHFKRLEYLNRCGFYLARKIHDKPKKIVITEHRPATWSCSGMVFSSDGKEIYIYFESKNCKNRICHSTINRYSVRIDGFTCLTPTDQSQVAEFNLKPQEEWLGSTKLVLNFKTLTQDGYLQLKMADQEFCSGQLVGDHISFSLAIPQLEPSSIIQVVLYQAELYSVARPE